MQFILNAIEAKQAYVSNLPVWVQYWMSFMQVVFGIAIVFVWTKAEARWILLATLASVVVALIWGGVFGFGRMWGAFHIIFYTPVLIYCYKRRQQIDFRSLYGTWVTIASATMLVSLLFDSFDVIRALMHRI